MKSVDWGTLYKLYGSSSAFTADELEMEGSKLMKDTDEVQNQKGTANENKKWDISEMDGDHIISWAKGGKTVLENGQMLCRKHNHEKSDN